MDSKLLHNDYVALIIRLIIGVMFIYASYDKITTPAEFARIIYNYHLLPGELVNLAALIMPWMELICGIALIAGIYRRGSIVIINLMLVIFAVAIAINLIRGVNLECGCFSVSSRAKSNALELLLRDIGLLILGVYLFINKSTRFDLLKSKS